LKFVKQSQPNISSKSRRIRRLRQQSNTAPVSPAKNASKKPTAPPSCEAGACRSSESAGNTSEPLKRQMRKAAEAAAVAEFDLSAEQRQRLVVSERG